MPYPFNDSPLNEYLVHLRKLKEVERNHYLLYFFTSDENNSEKLLAFKSYQQYSNKINELKESCPIKPRKTHIFNNKAELAVTTYEIDNPEPYCFQDCTHDKLELRIDTHADNTTHLVEQCTKCGIKLKRRRKGEINHWKRLSKIDRNLGEDERKRHSEWKNKRHEIYKNSLIEGDNIPPNFDFEDFRKKYESLNPPIFSGSCVHQSGFITTYRKYSNGNDAVVKQCSHCGKHIGTIKKSKIKDINKLPIFDETKEKIMDEIYTEWLDNFHVSLKEAKLHHDETIRNNVLLGKYSYKVNNTFNTYYSSCEWQWARATILKRDNDTCQSCGGIAECVHHMTYERLGKESSLDLISLCNSCHMRVHEIQRSYDYSFSLCPAEIRGLDNFRVNHPPT